MTNAAETDDALASVLGEIHYVIDLLRSMQNPSSRDQLLQRLQELIEGIANIEAEPTGGAMPMSSDAAPAIHAPEAAVPAQGAKREFTREELSHYNGTNGYPSYVAVNGIVYDVTNIPIWQTGTHFGLRAGQSLSVEFNTCHSNRPMVLDELQQVGRMVDADESLV